MCILKHGSCCQNCWKHENYKYIDCGIFSVKIWVNHKISKMTYFAVLNFKHEAPGEKKQNQNSLTSMLGKMSGIPKPIVISVRGHSAVKRLEYEFHIKWYCTLTCETARDKMYTLTGWFYKRFSNGLPAGQRPIMQPKAWCRFIPLRLIPICLTQTPSANAVWHYTTHHRHIGQTRSAALLLLRMAYSPKRMGGGQHCYKKNVTYARTQMIWVFWWVGSKKNVFQSVWSFKGYI